MLISAIDKEYTKEEATSANAYVAVDSETLGTGKLAVSALGGGGSSGYGSDWLIVNFSYDANTNTYTADKTFNEINQWRDELGTMSSFNRIKGYMNGIIFNLMKAADHQTPWTFEGSVIMVMNGVPAINYALVTISYDDVVSLNTQLFNLATTQGE